MSLIIDSEAHPWVRKPPNWRRPSGYDSSAEEVARRLHDESGWEPRAPLGEKAAAVWWPSRNADAVPEETGGAAEPFTFARNTVDANAAYVGIPRTTIRVGYGFEQMDRGIRTTDGYQDDILRASVDFVGNQYVSLRALYEKTDREAINLHPEALAHAAMQPAARFFDEASKKRDRTTFVVDVTPTVRHHCTSRTTGSRSLPPSVSEAEGGASASSSMRMAAHTALRSPRVPEPLLAKAAATRPT